MQHRFIYLLALTLSGLLLGCSTQQMRTIGESRCLDLPGAQLGDRLDCATRNKRVFDEFEKTQKPDLLPLKNATPEADPLCYKNSRAGEKPCAATETTGK
jgi:hypothetical protein